MGYNPGLSQIMGLNHQGEIVGYNVGNPRIVGIHDSDIKITKHLNFWAILFFKTSQYCGVHIARKCTCFIIAYITSICNSNNYC